MTVPTTRGHLDSRTGKPATVYTPPECLTQCPTCNNGRSRETVGMVCQTCGTDYGAPAPKPRPVSDDAPGAGLSEDERESLDVAITSAINYHSFDAMAEMSDFDMADAIVDTTSAASAPGGLVAAVETILTARLAAAEAARARDLAALRAVVAGIEGEASCTCKHDDAGRTDSRGCGRHFLLALLDDNAATRRDLAALRERAEVAEAKVAAVERLAAEWGRHGIGISVTRLTELRAALADRPAGGEGR